jgi:hypothetical protein
VTQAAVRLKTAGYVRKGPRGIGHMPHRRRARSGSLFAAARQAPWGHYGPLGRLGAIKPTTAAPARFIRDQRFDGFFICWSCCCCPAVFVCGSDFAGFCIGSCGSGDGFRFVFFGIAEDDLTFGFFGFFTGSASAFVTLIVVPNMTFLRDQVEPPPDPWDLRAQMGGDSPRRCSRKLDSPYRIMRIKRAASSSVILPGSRFHRIHL